jgi:hypothetical protein
MAHNRDWTGFVLCAFIASNLARGKQQIDHHGFVICAFIASRECKPFIIRVTITAPSLSRSSKENQNWTVITRNPMANDILMVI